MKSYTCGSTKDSKSRTCQNFKVINAISLATLTLLSSNLYAQESQEVQKSTKPSWLDTITVVGTRTETSVFDSPSSVSVIDQETLEKQAPDSIAAILKDLPSVDVVDSSIPGMQRLRIRGESSHRVTILVDGQEITDHSDYGTPILVDTANVERIDVIRGPASVLYGAKAIGGVINIITKKGADKPIQLELGGSYYSGTRGKQGWMALSGTLDDFDYRISASADDHNDRIIPKGKYSSNGKLNGSEFRNSDTSLHLGYKFGSSKNHYLALKVDEHKLSTDSWVNPKSLDDTTKSFSINLPKRDLRKVGLYYDAHDLGPLVRKIHVDAYYQTVDRLFENSVLVQPTPFMSVNPISKSKDKNINYGGTAQIDLKLSENHYTIAGFQYLMDDLDSKKETITNTKISLPFPPITIDNTDISNRNTRASIKTASFFAQNEWFVTPDLTLTAGLRYYNVKSSLDKTNEIHLKNARSKKTNKLVKSLGITWSGIEDTTLRALYSEGYTMPSLTQLYTDTTGGGQTARANPNLKPETSKNYEIGARYANNGLVLDASAFYTKSKNYLGTTSCALAGTCATGWGANDITHINVNSADSHGIELVAEYAIPNTGFKPYLSGAWIQRKLNYEKFSTKNSGTPALSGRIGVQYETQLYGNKVWADLYVRTSTAIKQTSKNNRHLTERLPGWGTLNFAVGAIRDKGNKTQVSLEFNNLLNKEYRSAFDALPGTGRSVILTMRTAF